MNEQEPESKAPNNPELANNEKNIEVLLNISFKRLLSIANDLACDRGGLDYINGLNDRASDVYEYLETGTHNSSTKIEFMAQAARSHTDAPDFIHYFLGVQVHDEIGAEELPAGLVKSAFQNYPDFVDEDEDADEEEDENPDAEQECIRVLSVYINFDSENNFSSWTGVYFEVDDVVKEAISQDEADSVVASGRSSESDLDDSLTKAYMTLNKIFQ